MCSSHHDKKEGTADEISRRLQARHDVSAMFGKWCPEEASNTMFKVFRQIPKKAINPYITDTC